MQDIKVKREKVELQKIKGEAFSQELYNPLNSSCLWKQKQIATLNKECQILQILSSPCTCSHYTLGPSLHWFQWCRVRLQKVNWRRSRAEISL